MNTSETQRSEKPVSKIRYGEDSSLKININAFQQGSLVTEFLFLFDRAKDVAIPLLPMAGNIIEMGKYILEGYKTYIDIKKFLKGKPPKETKVLDGNNIQMISQDNSKMVINYYDFRTVQSNTVAKNAAKAVQPLTKPDNLLEEIDLFSDDKIKIEIPKEIAPFIETDDNFQTLSAVKYKGIISKIDTKARSGYIDIGS